MIHAFGFSGRNAVGREGEKNKTEGCEKFRFVFARTAAALVGTRYKRNMVSVVHTTIIYIYIYV